MGGNGRGVALSLAGLPDGGLFARTEIDSFALATLWEGLIHPALGGDHLLAMTAVGVLSATIGRGAIWGMPNLVRS